MGIRGKYESKLHNIALSCDAFTTGYLVMCLLFFAPYAATFGGKLVMWFLPIAALVPFVIMPLVYMLVHRADFLLFGRYHLIMPTSAFISALFFVVAFCARGRGAADDCLIFFGVLVFAASILIYRYCAFSVRARLGNGSLGFSPLSACFSAAGSVSAIAAYYGFLYYDPSTAFLNTAYVLSAACVVLALAQYLTTYYGIPRLGGKRVQSAKNVFRALFSGLDKRAYLSALFFLAAFATIAALTVYFASAVIFDMYKAATCTTVFVACYAVGMLACERYVKHRSKGLSIAELLCATVAAGLLIAVAFIDFSRATEACVMIAAGVTGIGGAMAVRQTRLRFITIKPRITSGVIFVLYGLTAFAAVAVAFLVAAVVTEILYAAPSVTAFVYGFAAAGVFAVVAFALAGKKRVNAVDAQGLSYEYNAADACSTEQSGDADFSDSAQSNLSNGAISASDKE